MVILQTLHPDKPFFEITCENVGAWCHHTVRVYRSKSGEIRAVCSVCGEDLSGNVVECK